MEKRNQEQRVAIKFCARLGETASETYAKIVRVYGDSALSRAQVFRRHKEFKEGRESVEDDARSGRPVEVRTEANVQRIRAKIREDQRLTVRMLASELSMNRETVRQILTDDFGMKKLCTKMVPKNLSEEQKQHRNTVAEDCLEQVENDPLLLDRVITGDQSWLFQYDPETKRQSSQWLSPRAPRPKKTRMNKSKVKSSKSVGSTPGKGRERPKKQPQIFEEDDGEEDEQSDYKRSGKKPGRKPKSPKKVYTQKKAVSEDEDEESGEYKRVTGRGRGKKVAAAAAKRPATAAANGGVPKKRGRPAGSKKSTPGRRGRKPAKEVDSADDSQDKEENNDMDSSENDHKKSKNKDDTEEDTGANSNEENDLADGEESAA